VALTIPAVVPTPSPPKWVWVLEEKQRPWRFDTFNFTDGGPVGWPEFTYTSSPPMDDDHELRNPQFTFDNPGGHADFSNLRDHSVNLGNPAPYITPGGKTVEMKVKSWGGTFPIYLRADVV